MKTFAFYLALLSVLAVFPLKTEDSVPMKVCKEAQLDTAVAAIDGMLIGLQSLDNTTEIPVSLLRSMLNKNRAAIIAHKDSK